MAVKIQRSDDPDRPEKGALVADRRLWLNAGGTRVVEDGDPAAALQLAAPGRPIPKADVERLGLQLVDGAIRQGTPATKPAAKPKRRSRPADKMRKPAEDKGAKSAEPPQGAAPPAAE